MLKKLGFNLLPALSLTLILSSSTLAQGEKKTAFGVLIDNANSLEKRFPQVLMFSKQVVKLIHPRGPISLFKFTQGERNTWGRLLVVSSTAEWSQDENALSGYIDDISVVAGHQTDLYGAITTMAEVLNAKADAAGGTFTGKVIILITSGHDSVFRESKGMVVNTEDARDNNRKAKQQAIKLLKESGIKVYAVGFTHELNGDTSLLSGSSPRVEAEEFLRKITKETGGRAVFPKTKNISIDDVDKMLNDLSIQ